MRKANFNFFNQNKYSSVAVRKPSFLINKYQQKKYLPPVVQKPLLVNVLPTISPVKSRLFACDVSSVYKNTTLRPSYCFTSVFGKNKIERNLFHQRIFSSLQSNEDKKECSNNQVQKPTSEKIVNFVLTLMLCIVLIPWLYVFFIFMMWFVILIIVLLINLPFY